MDITTMRAVLNTLCKISVSGKENHGYILGLIQLFETEITKAERGQDSGQDHPIEGRE